MKLSILAAALVVSLASLGTLGCASDPALDTSSEAVSQASLVGSYQFEIGAERRSTLRAELAKKLAGAELEAAYAELDAEAAASRLVFGEDGVFVSLIGEREIAREAYSVRTGEEGDFLVGVGGKEARVELVDGVLLRIHDPEKGVLEFRRVER